jgi:hypothetical protein
MAKEVVTIPLEEFPSNPDRYACEWTYGSVET